MSDDLIQRLRGEDLKAARDWLAAGHSGAVLARSLGVAKSTISALKNGKTYRTE